MNTTTLTAVRAALSATAAAGLVVAALAAPATASGGGDGRVERSGSCSGSADWKLKAKPDDGRIEVEGEVDSNVNGQVWAWKIKHDGNVSASGRSTTRAPSGSFSVERRMVDTAGSDVFTFRAENTRSGEVCRGTVTL